MYLTTERRTSRVTLKGNVNKNVPVPKAQSGLHPEWFSESLISTRNIIITVLGASDFLHFSFVCFFPFSFKQLALSYLLRIVIYSNYRPLKLSERMKKNG